MLETFLTETGCLGLPSMYIFQGTNGSVNLIIVKFSVPYFVLFSRASTRLLAATTLRNVLGMRDLAQLLSDREAISHMMQANLDEATDPWGVEVERVEM